MTCIVGVVDQGVVSIGGDSAGVSGWTVRARRDAKVFVAGGFIYGFTSSFRMGQLLRYRFSPPPIAAGEDLMRYMATSWVDGVRQCFRDYSYGAIKDGLAQEGGIFLVGTRGRPFQIFDDFQVSESRANYDATGSGEPYALGSLHSSALWPGRRRVRAALEAAATHNIGVRGPFVIASLKAGA